MTIKDYKLIARAMKKTRPHHSHECYAAGIIQWKEDVITISHALESDNENYREEAFFSACGMYDYFGDEVC